MDVFYMSGPRGLEAATLNVEGLHLVHPRVQRLLTELGMIRTSNPLASRPCGQVLSTVVLRAEMYNLSLV